eukprot:gnl/TRDRNA2_/TRDRNA2_89813_c0_seq1.p1 gnl/TRDRNA2_/TRDRNA2_89813_c0~~gnl/TRDRNA2_/TRDRNA2_89813_c0_seq1.p1  ORF type:complete len:356 (-),score=67.91 gnl/TRDRNA2_/TRDRNA2_89813_c0_seq1:10-1077(-)
MTVVDVNEILPHLEEALRRPEFVSQIQTFTAEQCGQFDDNLCAGTENRLEWTQSHQAYCSLVEQYIAQSLGQVEGFSMDAFEEALPQWFEASGDAAKSDPTLELLNSLTDFTAFRDMMILAKKGAGLGPAQLITDAITIAEEHREAAQQLEHARALLEENENQWQPVSSAPWYQLHAHPDPSGFHVHIHRMNASIKTPPWAIPALLGLAELRVLWDDFCETAETHQSIRGEDDIVLRLIMKPPMVSRREVFLRRIIARDFPSPGCLAVVGSDAACGPPADGCVRGSLRLLNAIARPSAESPDVSNLTFFGQIDMGLPQFMANFVVRNMLPRLVSKLEGAYEKLKDHPAITTFRSE